jgi:hypothetical protein
MKLPLDEWELLIQIANIGQAEDLKASKRAQKEA